MPILWRSPPISGFAVLISTIMGLPLAVWIGLGRFSWKRIVLTVVQTWTALPTLVVGLAHERLLSHRGLRGSLGWLFSPQAMVLAQVILDHPHPGHGPIVDGSREAAAAELRAPGTPFTRTRIMVD